MSAPALPPFCTCRCHDTWFEPKEPRPNHKPLLNRPYLMPIAPKMVDEIETALACTHCQHLHLHAQQLARLQGDDGA